MANGFCDVPQCKEPTYMGWRPLTEKTGRQICEIHWNAHKAGTFDLYDAFGFKRPPTMTKTVKLKDYCSCGRERQTGHKYCQTCIADRKRQQRKESYHRKKNRTPSDNSQTKTLICKTEGCQNEREPGHSYCDRCAETRMYRSRNKINRKYYISHRA